MKSSIKCIRNIQSATYNMPWYFILKRFASASTFKNPFFFIYAHFKKCFVKET